MHTHTTYTHPLRVTRRRLRASVRNAAAELSTLLLPDQHLARILLPPFTGTRTADGPDGNTQAALIILNLHSSSPRV